MASEPFIPRALSITEGDEHWRPDCFVIGRTLEISLDGVKQEKVISYDMDAGEVKRIAVDEQGQIKIDRELEEVITETVQGEVTVTGRTDDAPFEQVGRGQRPG